MANLIASDNAQVIQQASTVELHFALRLPAGELIDSTFEKTPASFRMGDGNLLPSFEDLLLGLQAGDERRFQVEPEDAFGPRRQENLRRLPRNKFADTELTQPLETGLMVSFAGPGGELPGVVTWVSDAEVQVDFNHPLAGNVILFDVKIITVDNSPSTQPATFEPISS